MRLLDAYNIGDVSQLDYNLFHWQKKLIVCDLHGKIRNIVNIAVGSIMMYVSGRGHFNR